MQKVIYVIGLAAPRLVFLMGSRGFYIQFRQSFTKETFSHDERLKNKEFKYESHEECSNSETGVLGTF